MTHGEKRSSVQQDRPDDEKTIRVEPSFSDERDLEASKARSESASVKEQSTYQDTEFVEDDYPDGGLKAWAVVVGVSAQKYAQQRELMAI